MSFEGIRAVEWSGVDLSNPEGEAISSVSENSRNPGCQVKVETKNPNGVALTFSGLCSPG